MSLPAFSDRNWGLIRRVVGIADSSDWAKQSDDAATRYAYRMNEVIDAAREEGSEMVVKIMSGPAEGQLWLVGSGMLSHIETCGTRLND